MTATPPAGPGPSAEELLDRFPPFPSMAGRGPAQLARVLAGMGNVGIALEMLARALMTAGRLDPIDRELAILRLAWLARSDYVWGGHAVIAADVGLHLGEGVEAASPAGGGLIVAAVDQLDATGRIEGPTRAVLAEVRTEAEIIELIVLVGAYRSIAMLIAGTGLEPEPGCPSLPSDWPGPAPAPAGP